VYIFHYPTNAVSLTLNQGITQLRSSLGLLAAKSYLASNAAEIRSRLRFDANRWDTSLRLSSSLPIGPRQSAYEAGNILARHYTMDALPGEAELRSHLMELFRLYDAAIAIREYLRQVKPDATVPSGVASIRPPLDITWHFTPKDDSEYVARINGIVLQKSRRHETILRKFTDAITKRGFRVSNTVHPRDLLIERNGRRWLVEAKVIYNGDAVQAVRSATGQLLWYRHVYHDEEVALMALFSEPIGDLSVQFLETIGIGVVWHSEGGWRGSISAEQAGFVDSPYA
jgi:hypothetical protein